MNATTGQGTILITLSRRNLLTLLHKLDDADSKRTLLRRLDDGTTLYVHSESDEVHYAGRERGAGPMPRDIEDIIAADAAVRDVRMQEDLQRRIAGDHRKLVDDANKWLARRRDNELDVRDAELHGLVADLDGVEARNGEL